MAKSLRSKWRRKMRNIKRERYGKKELIKLKKMLGLPTDEETPSEMVNIDVDGETEADKIISNKDRRRIHSLVRGGSDREDSDAEKEIEEVIVLTTSRKLRQSYRLKKEKEAALQEVLDKVDKEETVEEKDSTPTIQPTTIEMEHDQKRVYNDKTLQDQYGNYPIWMNGRKMRTLAKVNRRKNNKMKKRLQKTTKYNSIKRDRDDDETSETVEVADNEVQDVSMESMEAK